MRKATIAIVVTAMLALALFGAMNGGGGTPALAAAPTPVSVTQPVRLPPVLYTLFSGTAITASAQGTCRELGGFSVADVQTNIDVSDTQTVTVKIQYSNDGTNLVDGANLSDRLGRREHVLPGAAVRALLMRLRHAWHGSACHGDRHRMGEVTMNASALQTFVSVQAGAYILGQEGSPWK